MWKNNQPKPVIGLAGGIGSGKTYVSEMLERMGCGVIHADQDAHEVLNSGAVKAEITKLWGGEILRADGMVDRKKVAGIVFGSPAETGRLNGIIHPRVAAIRQVKTAKFMADKDIRAVVWDVPLLFEVGLERECDAVIFVKAPVEERLRRVRVSRGWDEAELTSREKLQFPLDKKQKMADYVVDNNSGEESASLRQVEQVLSQILSRTPPEK